MARHSPLGPQGGAGCAPRRVGAAAGNARGCPRRRRRRRSRSPDPASPPALSPARPAGLSRRRRWPGTGPGDALTPPPPQHTGHLPPRAAGATAHSPSAWCRDRPAGLRGAGIRVRPQAGQRCTADPERRAAPARTRVRRGGPACGRRAASAGAGHAGAREPGAGPACGARGPPGSGAPPLRRRSPHLPGLPRLSRTPRVPAEPGRRWPPVAAPCPTLPPRLQAELNVGVNHAGSEV